MLQSASTQHYIPARQLVLHHPRCPGPGVWTGGAAVLTETLLDLKKRKSQSVKRTYSCWCASSLWLNSLHQNANLTGLSFFSKQQSKYFLKAIINLEQKIPKSLWGVPWKQTSHLLSWHHCCSSASMGHSWWMCWLCVIYMSVPRQQTTFGPNVV